MTHPSSPARSPSKGRGRGLTRSTVTGEFVDLSYSADVEEPYLIWDFKRRDLERRPKDVFHSLLNRVSGYSSAKLYDAVELGVPTYVVILLADALGHKPAWAMDLVGVSESTFRRKDEASEPLPEVAGHRAMGFLRIVATLKRLLQESGDPESMASFDLEAWVSDWVQEPLPEFGGKTPADMLRNPEGQRAVEELLERMRGGVAA